MPLLRCWACVEDNTELLRVESRLRLHMCCEAKSVKKKKKKSD